MENEKPVGETITFTPAEELIFNHAVDCTKPGRGCWNRGFIEVRFLGRVRQVPCACLSRRLAKVEAFRKHELGDGELARIMRRAKADERSKEIQKLYQRRKHDGEI